MGGEQMPPVDGASPVPTSVQDPNAMQGPQDNMDNGLLPDDGADGDVEGNSEIDDLYNSLSDEDKLAAKKYIESMVDKNKEDEGDVPPVDDVQDDANAVPMAESVILTKNQIKKLNEIFNAVGNEEDNDKKAMQDKKVNGNNKKATPFDAPNLK